MKSLINRRGSKAATRALKRFGAPQRAVSSTKTQKLPMASCTCKTCDNAGWETISKVAACNCCEDQEFYTPTSGNRQAENELD